MPDVRSDALMPRPSSVERGVVTIGDTTKQLREHAVIDFFLERIAGGQNLTSDEMMGIISEIMQGHWSDAQIAQLLSGLAKKGETVAEVAGAALALRRHMTPIRSHRTGLLDTCGTGGDGSSTFNISTAAGLIAAAAGVPVAKHGNRGMTSRCGSANVLAELGLQIEAPLPVVEACLDELGICFCFAPLWHPSMQRVAGVRKELGIRTIFNILGPLCNPARAPFQLLGVGRPELRLLLAEALLQLGTSRAFVVCGEDGLDEVTLAGRTSVAKVADGHIEELHWYPEDFGLVRAPIDTLRVDSPAASAAIIRGILDGEMGPPRDIVILNAAAALLVAGRAQTPTDAASIAAETIDNGQARELLARLVKRTRE